MVNHDLMNAATLRRLAEEHLKHEPPLAEGPLSPSDMQRFLHELQVHQIELKLQNEELLASQADLEDALARYTDFYDFAPTGYFTLDRDGVILQTNLPGARLVGTERSKVVGQSLKTFIARSDRKSFEDYLTKVFEDLSRHICTLDLLGEGKTTLTVQLEGVRSPDHTEARVVIVDISEQKRAAAEREKLQEQLFQSLKMDSVGQLAGGVAHDFNNILAAILGHAELALLEVSPEHPVTNALQEIHKSAERSADLIGQLLAFARRQTTVPQVIDFNQTIDRTLKMIRPLIGESIDLVWRPGRDLWPVKIDPAQIDQVLVNLCINARDAISGIGTLVVATSNITIDTTAGPDFPEGVESGGDFVELTVRDTGCGMNKATQARIFEPFFTTKKLGSGTGLGLATVYGIVKQNRGILRVTSELDQGTTLTICLPRNTEPHQATESQAPNARGQAGQETILLVEDEPAVLELTRRMLESLGYRVLATQSPHEALGLAEQHADRIHMLLTDVVMPEMNGRDLVRKLLTRIPGLKHLFMSGYTANIIAHHGVIDNGLHFIKKPFSMKDLAQQVREALDD